MALPRGAMSLPAVCNCGTHLLFMWIGMSICIRWVDQALTDCGLTISSNFLTK